MTTFVPVSDAVQTASYTEQKAIGEQLAEIVQRLRRQMDAGLTPEDMKVASAQKDAAEAAQEILTKLFE